MSQEDGSQPDIDFVQPQNPEVAPTEYRNLQGYENLIFALAAPREVQDPISRAGAGYYLEPVKAEAKIKAEEIRGATREIFSDLERRDLLLEGIDKTLQMLLQREQLALILRYGLRNPENTGKSLEEVGSLLGNISTGEIGVSRARADQILQKATRKMRHPSRSKHYRDYLPPIENSSVRINF